MAGQRHIDPADLQMLPGVLANRTARNAKGRWVEGDNVRWRDGLPEKFGGFTEVDLVDSEGLEPLWYMGRGRACIEWSSLDGQNWIALGTHCKLYLFNNDRLYNITPLRKVSTIVNGFATTNGSALVTVTDVGHECVDGSHVIYRDATAVGGITIAGEYEVESVIDLDTYTIRHTQAATSTTTGGGTVYTEYELNCGLESDGILDGFGTGDYGEGTWGTPREDSTFGGRARVWALDNFGEDLLASPNGEGLYWWDHTTGPDSRATLRENAPAQIEWMLVGPDDRHVIAFGCNTVGTGVQDRMFIRWCVGDDFDDWISTEDNDAGSKRLDTGSELITAVRTRTNIVAWSDKALYAGNLVAGTDVYEWIPLGRVQPIVSKNAAVEIDGVIYWMGQDDFFMYDGVISTLPCDMRQYVFGELNRPMQSKVFCRYIREFSEIRWHFTSIYADENDRTAIYNIREKCWYPSSIRRECGLDRVGFYGRPVSFYDERTFMDEDGTDVDDDEALVARLETFDGEIAAGAVDMEVAKLIPDFKELEGSIDVQLFGRNRPQMPLAYSRLANIDANTDEFTVPFKRKRIGMLLESNQMGDHWRMDTWQTRIVPHGGR